VQSVNLLVVTMQITVISDTRISVNFYHGIGYQILKDNTFCSLQILRPGPGILNWRQKGMQWDEVLMVNKGHNG
jgi:hypothetical protein